MRGKNRMGTDGQVLFKDLAIGEVFEFQRAELPRYNGLPGGPWKKTSARKYERCWDGMTSKVGSINTEVTR